MAPLLKYTALRLVLFAATLSLLLLLRTGWLVGVVGAALISMMLAYLWLRGPRDQLAEKIEKHAHHRIVAAQDRVNAAANRDAAIEDAADEVTRTQPPGTAS